MHLSQLKAGGGGVREGAEAVATGETLAQAVARRGLGEAVDLARNHFSHAPHRQPGDLRPRMFGTATRSFADEVRAQERDVFEIEAAAFGPLRRNPLRPKNPAEKARLDTATPL